MKDRSRRTFSVDRISILLLVLAIILLALGGAKVSQITGANLLRRDGLDTTNSWAESVIKNNSDIPAIVGGAVPSVTTKTFLANASKIGDIYRFRIWNKTGQLVLDSDQPNTVPQAHDLHGQRINSPTSVGFKLATSDPGHTSKDPAHFGISSVAITQNGATVGIFEIYIDESDDFALYQSSFHLNEIVIAISVLLAGGLPSFMVHRKMLAFRKSQAETLFLAEHDSLTCRQPQSTGRSDRSLAGLGPPQRQLYRGSIDRSGSL
jgi:hypothetical protein